MKQTIQEKWNNNVIYIIPQNSNILAKGQIEQIFNLLNKIANKNKNENFSMMPKLTNIELATGEIVEAIPVTNFKKGEVSVLGIFAYDYTKIKYEEVKSVLEKNYNSLLLN